MIKRCPECNRTYSDESISFCLADGALLSAPFGAMPEEPPPTEILPSKEVPPTEPPKQAVPTMTSLPGGLNTPPVKADELKRQRPYAAFVWAAIALIVLGGIVVGILGVRRVLNKQSETVATSSPDPLLAQNTSSPTESSQASTTTSTATETETSGRNVNANKTETKSTSSPQIEAKVTDSPAPPATVHADPVLVPPDSRQTSETKQPEPTDYSKVFSQREVDTKAQLLARPKPSYTDSARQNNVQGTVVLRVVLSADGSVGSVSTIRGLSHGLTEKAIAAARQIKFAPAKKDGRPVSVAVTIEYNFSVY